MSYYIYNCQVCGRNAKLAFVIECGGCGRKLCEHCAIYSFCPDCIQHLTPQDRAEALSRRKMFFRMRNSIYIYCAIMVAVTAIAIKFENEYAYYLMGAAWIGFVPFLCCMTIGNKKHIPKLDIINAMWARARQNPSNSSNQPPISPQPINKPINTQKPTHKQPNNQQDDITFFSER